jgi:hypothetical protein
MLTREMRREILRSLAVDHCLIWEPLGIAETLAPALDEDGRIALAVESLVRLLDEDLIYFFRCDSVDGTDQAATDDSARLSTEEVRALLAAREWVRRPPQGVAQTVWFELTRKGVDAWDAQKKEEDVEWLENQVKREFDGVVDRETNDSVAIRAANDEERETGELGELTFKTGATAIDVACTYFRGIDDLDTAWVSVTAGTRNEIFDGRWHNEHAFVCGKARLAEHSTGRWQVAWTNDPGRVLIVASAATAESLVDLFVNSARKHEGRRFLIAPEGLMWALPTAVGLKTASMSRVAAYVREPHASSIRRSARAKDDTIRQARPHLAALGWTSLEFQHAEWDDDPQQDKAFYIYFFGIPPGGESSEFSSALGAVDCIAFTPNLRRRWTLRGR